ncbi:hypothetical protein FCG67_07080 [Rhodococcus oryzae]|uniref:Magnesium transporter n=1 Tax=Rhodococcus oryzae TaxID=2571143 RepID=A0ABY2RMG0_9NOCA|nr:CorA family divalent cation transporter [Rhodococcus oryzae]TJZ79393.1 hypothetical protein FCG67_07080 [Rhodococcus oryzae]
MSSTMPTNDYAQTTADPMAPSAQNVELLRNISTELRGLNTEMEEICEITQDQLKVTEQTRRVTAWTAVAVVPGALGSLYGSNFEHMPELKFYYGWPIFLCVLATSALATYFGMRRKGWL